MFFTAHKKIGSSYNTFIPHADTTRKPEKIKKAEKKELKKGNIIKHIKYNMHTTRF